MYCRKEEQHFAIAYKTATNLSKFRGVFRGEKRPCTVWAPKVGLGYKNKNINFQKKFS